MCVSVQMWLTGSSASECKGDKERKKQKNESKCNCNETERWGWGAGVSGISYGPRGRAVDKSPSYQGSRRGEGFKVSLMFLNLSQKKWFNSIPNIKMDMGNITVTSQQTSRSHCHCHCHPNLKPQLIWLSFISFIQVAAWKKRKEWDHKKARQPSLELQVSWW